MFSAVLNIEQMYRQIPDCVQAHKTTKQTVGKLCCLQKGIVPSSFVMDRSTSRHTKKGPLVSTANLKGRPLCYGRPVCQWLPVLYYTWRCRRLGSSRTSEPLCWSASATASLRFELSQASSNRIRLKLVNNGTFWKLDHGYEHNVCNSFCTIGPACQSVRKCVRCYQRHLHPAWPSQEWVKLAAKAKPLSSLYRVKRPKFPIPVGRPTRR